MLTKAVILKLNHKHYTLMEINTWPTETP